MRIFFPRTALFFLALIATFRLASSEQPRPPELYAGRIVIIDGQERVYAEDRVRKSGAWLEGRLEFSYDLRKQEFRLIGYTSDGTVQRNDVLTRRPPSTFSIRKVRGDGVTTLTELSFVDSQWTFHLLAGDFDITAKGKAYAVAEFLRLDAKFSSSKSNK